MVFITCFVIFSVYTACISLGIVAFALVLADLCCPYVSVLLLLPQALPNTSPYTIKQTNYYSGESLPLGVGSSPFRLIGHLFRPLSFPI